MRLAIGFLQVFKPVSIFHKVKKKCSGSSCGVVVLLLFVHMQNEQIIYAASPNFCIFSV